MPSSPRSSRPGRWPGPSRCWSWPWSSSSIRRRPSSCCSPGPILVLLLGFIGGRARAITEQRFAEVRWLSAFFLDMLGGLATLKMFGRSREQVDTIATISRRYGDTTMEVLRTAFQTSLVLEWGGAVAVALVAVEISLRLMDGIDRVRPRAGGAHHRARVLPAAAHAGDALPLGRRRPGGRRARVRDPRRAASRARGGRHGRAVAGRAAPGCAGAPVPTGGDDPVRGRVGSPTRADETPALDRLDLRIPPAGVVALVGATGAGKSTLASLLLRFIEPDAGVDPRRRHAAGEHRSVGLAGTHSPGSRSGRTCSTARSRTTSGWPDPTPPTRRWLRPPGRPARSAFIATLPRGFATPVGEGGVAA